MNQNNGSLSEVNGRYRFVFLGFLFPVFHYVIMLLVQAVASVIITAKLSLETAMTAAEIKQEALSCLAEYSDLLSLTSALLTVLLVVLVYCIIASFFVKWQMPKPLVKSYFSLHKIDKKLIWKLLLLSFFFYHFVLGFLNLVGLLAPNLMESYHDAAQSVDTGKSAFSLIMSFLALVVAAPLTEELVYRNMAIANMRSRLPAIFSIVVSSLIFGVFHGDLVWMLYASGMGVLFGLLYVKSESIYVSYLVHTGFNLIGYIYSVLSNFANDTVLAAVNSVSTVLILISLIGAPFVFIWIWRSFSDKII